MALRRYYLFIKHTKFAKNKKIRPSNEITEDEINYFLNSLRKINGYPKVRDLQKIFHPNLNPVKINILLRYLERSKRLEIDTDGNIVWISHDKNRTNQLSFAEAANISEDFLKYLSTKKDILD